MLSQERIETIVRNLCSEVQALFPGDEIEPILFGSYARGDEETDSDIDVLLLVNASRETISEHNWQIGDLAAVYLLDYGVVVSPIVENRAYYYSNSEVLPFYRNIQREGVKISA